MDDKQLELGVAYADDELTDVPGYGYYDAEINRRVFVPMTKRMPDGRYWVFDFDTPMGSPRPFATYRTLEASLAFYQDIEDTKAARMLSIKKTAIGRALDGLSKDLNRLFDTLTDDEKAEFYSTKEAFIAAAEKGEFVVAYKIVEKAPATTTGTQTVKAAILIALGEITRLVEEKSKEELA